MSKMCGDTARFHRIRKKRIRNRAKIRALRAERIAAKAVTPEPAKP